MFFVVSGVKNLQKKTQRNIHKKNNDNIYVHYLLQIQKTHKKMRKCKTTQKREDQLHQIQCSQFLFLKQIYDNKTKIIRTIQKKRDLIIIFCGLHISFKYISVSPSRDQHCFYCSWPSVKPTNTKEN